MRTMTVEELILELKYLPPTMQIFLTNCGTSRLKQYDEFSIRIAQPELADNYVSIDFNAKENQKIKVSSHESIQQGANSGQLQQHDVMGSVCEHCKFQEECRFKSENINHNCKYFIAN